MNIIVSLIVAAIQLLAVGYLSYKYIELKNTKESEFYTDYTHGNLTLRIFKPEFEYQAVGDINPYSILDRGNFSQFYLWALIDMKHENSNKQNNGRK